MNVPLPIPAYNTFELDLPVWFASKTKNYGDPKKPVWFSLANPTTTARNISNRKHEHSIDIRRKAIPKPVLHENEWDRATRENLTLEHLSPLDQERVEKVQAHAGRTFANYPVLSRGRPEVLPSNVIFARHHKDHTQEQKYGTRYLTKVSEVKVGKPIMYDDVPVSPSSSRATSIATASSGSSSSSSSSGSSRPRSRLSALATAIRSSPPSHASFEQNAGSESSDTSSASSERTRSSAGNVFRPNQYGRRPSSNSGSSSSGSHRPSVSRGKPPLKRKEPSQEQITAIQKRAEKQAEKQAKQQAKRKAQEDAREAKKKARDDAREAKRKAQEDASETSTVVSSVGDHPARPKGKTKWAKPTSSQGDVPLTKKARGRAPKYATKEEAYLAKLEQNKIGKQKRAEAKRKAQEEANK